MRRDVTWRDVCLVGEAEEEAVCDAVVRRRLVLREVDLRHHDAIVTPLHHRHHRGEANKLRERRM